MTIPTSVRVAAIAMAVLASLLLVRAAAVSDLLARSTSGWVPSLGARGR